MTMILKDKAPITAGRTRVFASDLVAVARVHQSLEFVLGESALDTDTAVKFAKLAIDVGGLIDCGVSPELVLAVAAVGLGNHIDHALTGVNALVLEGRGLSDAQRVWTEHLGKSRERKTFNEMAKLDYEAAQRRFLN
ncbi:MAG TPA: hypothetical protein VI669_12695 [Vicinamibacteria bacterium]